MVDMERVWETFLNGTWQMWSGMAALAMAFCLAVYIVRTCCMARSENGGDTKTSQTLPQWRKYPVPTRIERDASDKTKCMEAYQ